MTLDEAIKKAFDGHEVIDFKHHNHAFHIKPIAVTREAAKETAQGRISHDIRFRADDQVDYSIVKEREVIKDLHRCPSNEVGSVGSSVSLSS
jgi:hypothetical protein